jgi:hypothetical protein
MGGGGLPGTVLSTCPVSEIIDPVFLKTGPKLGLYIRAQAVGAQAASGYIHGDTLSTCYFSVSFSTFLRVAGGG